jgi:tRNA G18 (ribose-2'-O)-methylase SpoU
VRGISKQTLKNVDAIVEIPMRGKKESLNVSVAVGIALFTLLHK